MPRSIWSNATPRKQTAGQVFLWLAVVIFGASSAVTRKLTELGSQNMVNGYNPISLCNVLFVGNLCALLVLSVIHRRQLSRAAFGHLSRREWMSLVIVAILAGALAPSLIFVGLAQTSVNNVVLVGRLEPPLTLLLSVWILREPVKRWEVLGASTAFVGVVLTLTLQMPAVPMMTMGAFHIGRGEVMAVAGAATLAVATIISRARLGRVSIGLYSLVRTALGTLIFYIIAFVLYGGHHFMDVLSPFLWQWMLLYGAVIVVLGQSLWISGMRIAGISTASLVASFTPVAGLLAAFVILGETPTYAQTVGGGVILLGVGFGQIGVQRRRWVASKMRGSRMGAVEQVIELQMGFKGM
ncbi:MAG TPA: DMT family transporter [Stenomitos sp.]